MKVKENIPSATNASTQEQIVDAKTNKQIELEPTTATGRLNKSTRTKAKNRLIDYEQECRSMGVKMKRPKGVEERDESWVPLFSDDGNKLLQSHKFNSRF